VEKILFAKESRSDDMGHCLHYMEMGLLDQEGVYQIKPSFPFGSLPSLFTKSRAINDVFLEHAEKTKGLPHYGMYAMSWVSSLLLGMLKSRCLYNKVGFQ
jgi:hypothetical protein